MRETHHAKVCAYVLPATRSAAAELASERGQTVSKWLGQLVEREIRRQNRRRPKDVS